MSLADDISEFAYREYIRPSLDQGLQEVTIRAGDVHDKMGLKGRMPAVTGVIGTRIFERRYALKLIGRTGVTNGPNVVFTFSLTNRDQQLL